MDPNAQQPNTQPAPQQAPSPVGQEANPNPVGTVPPPTTATPLPESNPIAMQPPQSPKGTKKGIILLFVLILLILGMGYYVFFVKNQINKPVNNTTVAIPTVTPATQITDTPASVDEVTIASPDADLNDIEKDILGL